MITLTALVNYAVWFGLFVVLILMTRFLRSCIYVNYAYERTIFFRFGVFKRVVESGMFFAIPRVHKFVRVDTRIITANIEAQDTVTKDNVTVRVNAVLYYRVVDAKLVVLGVENYVKATEQKALTTMRNIIGQHDLDALLQQRDSVNARICDLVDRETNAWGIRIESLDIKDIEIPDSMQRAMAKEAEAAREKRARYIKAEAERVSAEGLAEAAERLMANPLSIELRRLQTMAEIGTEHNTATFVFIPSEIVSYFKNAGTH